MPPPAELQIGGIHFQTCSTTSAASVEQPYQCSVPSTTGDSLWQPVVPTSTYTSLENTGTMVTEPAAAATASAFSPDEGTTTYSEGSLMIAEEWTLGL